jgi:hypothetical protein
MKHPKVHTTEPNLHVQIFTFISFMHLNLGQPTAHNTNLICYDVKFPAAKTMGSGVPSFVAGGGGSKYCGLENDRCPGWSMGHSKYAGGYWEL